MGDLLGHARQDAGYDASAHGADSRSQEVSPGAAPVALSLSDGAAARPASRRRNRPKEKGMAFVWGAVSMLFLIPMVGLAIDSGVAFVIKTRLSIAVDSACLAAARSLNRGMTLSAQEASARATALRYFYANFPVGDWQTTGADPVVVIAESGDHMRTVTVNAVRTAPLYFLPVINKHFADVGVMGQASRRDTNVILVLDRSGSMQINGSVAAMKRAATSFASQFSNGKDQMGLVAYSTGVTRSMEPTQYFLSSSPSITTRINSITAAGATNSTGGLNAAYSMLTNLNEPGAVNAIVFFTDGIPNGVAQNFRNNSMPSPDATLILSGSTCPGKTTTDRIGLIAYGGHPNSTGSPTYGIYRHTSTSLTDDGQAAAANLSGCYMASNLADMYRDIARIPLTDLYGNLTRGFSNSYAVTATSMNNRRNLANASMNTVLEQTRVIRSNSYLKPVIYAIGLAPRTGDFAIEEAFMKRIANTEDSTFHNSSQTSGLYIYVPLDQQEDGLQEAFMRIASEILRLSL
ncbi:MAG: VWA domain-containing protein [Bryobacterales bacterium]|nr:VWA domain-containing protein [Bryobacterales bacterium]